MKFVFKNMNFRCTSPVYITIVATGQSNSTINNTKIAK